jgi:aryl-alcohol dehydrogenase-like predicted oxidoreductase
MKYRQLADSGLRVSEIGFGAWGIGGATPGATSYGRTEDEVSRVALEVALDRGITFFDTANVYGGGHSETLLGEVLGAARQRVVIATKAGMARFDAAPDYSPAAIRASLAGSLKRLRTDYVDLLQLHNASPELLSARPEIVGFLEDLKREGSIRAYGLSVKAPEEGRHAVTKLGLRILQVNFSMLDMRARECGLLDIASRFGASLIARTPLCFGFLGGGLTPDTVFGADDHRSRWPREHLQRWLSAADSLFGVLGAVPGPRSQIALRYCLSFPQVATVIPGMLTAREVEENSGASEAGPLPEGSIARLDEAYRPLAPGLRLS